jgi:hypothetical protein
MPETITIPAGAAAYTMSIAGQDNASQTYPATVTINLLSDPSYHVGTQAFRATLNIAPHVIAAARVKTADGTTLKWHTLAGRTYRVVYRDTPSGPWADLSGEIAATATTTSWTDTTASQVKRRFYHVYLVGGN